MPGCSYCVEAISQYKNKKKKKGILAGDFNIDL